MRTNDKFHGKVINNRSENKKRENNTKNMKIRNAMKKKDAPNRVVEMTVDKLAETLSNRLKNLHEKIYEGHPRLPDDLLEIKVKLFFQNNKLTSAVADSKLRPAPNPKVEAPSSTRALPQTANPAKLAHDHAGTIPARPKTANETGSSSAHKAPSRSASSGNSSIRSAQKTQRGFPIQSNISMKSTVVPATKSIPMSLSKQSTLTIEPISVLKNEVHHAMAERKTFTVVGQYPPIRKALQQRGWVEKYHPSHRAQLNDEMRKYLSFSIQELTPLLNHRDLGNMCKNLIKSKLLQTHQVDLYWAPNYDGFKECPDRIKYTLLNKIRRDVFSYTSKQGLCELAQNSYWYQVPGLCRMNHPRSYNLARMDETKHFVADFRLTASMSLLKWVIRMHTTKESKIISESGEIPLEVFEFAFNECCKMIKKGKHEDIDVEIPDATPEEWNKFLDYFYKTVHIGNHFRSDDKETEQSIVIKTKFILDKLRNYFPFLEMDGLMNIWILKPVAGSRGIGIHICRTLQYVLNTINNQKSNVRYIAQKYIERPLLIYNTKFDIRQWFLIFNTAPLTVWLYKQCYLRFSSQTYNLRKFHESIHLTNNSVQSKYKNASKDIVLPDYYMWDSREFQNYLSHIGYSNVYADIIYPGMKECVTAAIIMNEDKIDGRRNCFELYGADFILTEDFTPWLLEINSNPALYCSTPVTSRMCPQVLEDVIKVVVDHNRNHSAGTGHFEMIYQSKLTPNYNVKNANLELKGSSLKSDYFYTPENEFGEEKRVNIEEIDVKENRFVKSTEEEVKKTLKTLVHIVQNKK